MSESFTPNHQPNSNFPTMSAAEVRSKPLQELVSIAVSMNIENATELSKIDLIFEVLKAMTEKDGETLFTGVLEIHSDGFGFLDPEDSNFAQTQNRVYVGQQQIRKNALRAGDVISCKIRAPKKDGDKYYALAKVETINGLEPEISKKRPLFENLTPIYANELLQLEYHPDHIAGRMMDMFSPIGKGQRALVVAPPRSGKTELLKEIAHGISRNNPDVDLMVLLVDERPEEVTDMQRSVKGEVYSSTFDLPAKNHVRVAELVIERAKRRVENGRDVVILLDSITRLARAYNTVVPSSGKVLSGGVDANALQKPKRFFGAARNIENGGSLTIIATALIDTGSKMDEVIFEEFKGTGNSEVVLDRKLAERRIFPAIDVVKSGTRKEELLLDPDDLKKVFVLRSMLHKQADEIEGLKFLYTTLAKTKDNAEFLASMNPDKGGA